MFVFILMVDDFGIKLDFSRWVISRSANVCVSGYFVYSYYFAFLVLPVSKLGARQFFFS